MIGSLFSAQSSAMPPPGVSGLQLQPYAASSDAATSLAPAIAASTSSAPAPVSLRGCCDARAARTVLPLLRSHYLLGYVDDTLPCPPALVDGVHGTVINPAHRVWTAQDQANLSSIQGSLSPGVVGPVVFAKTSHEAWTILETTFSAQSQARANVLRRQLGESHKLDKTATDYYNQVRAIAYTLASIGQPITDAEFTSPALMKNMMAWWRWLMNVPTPPQCRHMSSTNAFCKLSSRWLPSSSFGSGGGLSKRVCQLCGREGHVAAKCHRRFQHSFLGLGNDGKDTRNNARQAAMADRPAPPPSQGQTQTYVDPHWYMDTGATDHLTSELGKLHTRDVYTGSDKVHTANGAGQVARPSNRQDVAGRLAGRCEVTHSGTPGGTIFCNIHVNTDIRDGRGTDHIRGSPAEHKKKYDQLKAIVDAELIGSFEKARHQVQRIHTTRRPRRVGSVSPFGGTYQSPATEINYVVAHSLHRHSESLVNTLERVALRVVQEIMKHQYSPSGSALGTHQGEVQLHTRPPLPYAMAAPQQQGSPTYVVYKVGGDPGDYQFLYEPPKEIPHGYVCTFVPDCNNRTQRSRPTGGIAEQSNCSQEGRLQREFGSRR
ncbi:hypothetical protein QYE76_051994 [Lolium multiflorum]|uniref:CCHC-type domain-containing protein n=1 Tax=Lolium multiflorum TaxID=4521 RepID=A0AAD8WL38_LOLMU|nr:hypothetical protein QYE76_051994 [Lolium multiflorum]